QAPPHGLGQLVDETERAVIVAGLDAVEDRAVELETERRARRLLDHGELLETATADLELDDGLVGLELIADDVADRFAVEGEDLVAGLDPGRGCRRAGRHRHDTRGGHAGILRDARITSPCRERTGRAVPSARARRTRAPRATPRLLRRGRDGDQGAGVDGPGV